jgi:hypothetical protein
MTNWIAVVLSDKKWRVFRASEESTRGNWGGDQIKTSWILSIEPTNIRWAYD